MKKIIILFASLLFAYRSIPATVANIKKLQENNITIVDIRTPDEWMSTGVIPGALRDTFFDGYGRITPRFFKILQKHHISKVALICRTGHRSAVASQILEQKGYDVVDLQGGMFYLMRNMLHIVFKR